MSKELQEPNKKEKSAVRQSWPQLQLPIPVPKVGSSKRASPLRRSPVARRKHQRIKSDEVPMAVLVKPLEEGKKEQQQHQRPLSANALKGNGQFCMHVACFLLVPVCLLIHLLPTTQYRSHLQPVEPLNTYCNTCKLSWIVELHTVLLQTSHSHDPNHTHSLKVQGCQPT